MELQRKASKALRRKGKIWTVEELDFAAVKAADIARRVWMVEPAVFGAPIPPEEGG